MTDLAQLVAPQALPGWRHVRSGPVRDLYVPDDGPDDGPDDDAPPGASQPVLVVASDRVRVGGHLLATPVPDKGRILTALSTWWSERLADLVPNPVVSLDVPAAVAGRATICRRLDLYPVGCVARGYLAGRGLAGYRAGGVVHGVPLPPGLEEGSRLPEPIFTPTTRPGRGARAAAATFEQVAATIGADDASRLRVLTLAVYRRAEGLARERGVVLADTRLWFGRDATGAVVLGDAVLTPDSSRFWPAEQWQPGRGQPNFVTQPVRDWLTSPASGWDRASDAPPPPLPAEVVGQTRARYVELFERLTGRVYA